MCICGIFWIISVKSVLLCMISREVACTAKWMYIKLHFLLSLFPLLTLCLFVCCRLQCAASRLFLIWLYDILYMCDDVKRQLFSTILFCLTSLSIYIYVYNLLPLIHFISVNISFPCVFCLLFMVVFCVLCIYMLASPSLSLTHSRPGSVILPEM